MATPQGRAKTKPAISRCMCFLFFIITVSTVTVNKPALAKADHASPPSTLELYFLLANSIVVATSPSGSFNGSEFGSIEIFNNFARESPAETSPVVGQAIGQVIVAKDGSQYVAFTYVLNASSYAGSISGQGVSNALGNGDLAITGGTGDFLSASGHIEARVLAPAVLLRSTIYITYD